MITTLQTFLVALLLLKETFFPSFLDIEYQPQHRHSHWNCLQELKWFALVTCFTSQTGKEKNLKDCLEIESKLLPYQLAQLQVQKTLLPLFMPLSEINLSPKMSKEQVISEVTIVDM